MDSPISEAKELLAKLEASTALTQSAAVAMLLRPESAAMFRRLIRYQEGYEAGATECATRISSVASRLLTEIAKLRAARRSGRSLADDFIEGTAPNLFSLAKLLQELLQG